MSGRLELEIPPEALAYSADDEAEDQWSENMMNWAELTRPPQTLTSIISFPFVSLSSSSYFA